MIVKFFLGTSLILLFSLASMASGSNNPNEKTEKRISMDEALNLAVEKNLEVLHKTLSMQANHPKANFYTQKYI